jgi:hypothetical protein
MQTENKLVNKLLNLHSYMYFLGIVLFIWWCPPITIGEFHLLSGIRWYMLVSEPWFANPNNMAHAIEMGIFLFFCLIGGKASINLAMFLLSIMLNLRILWALYCDIFVDTFNLFYILVDFASLTYVAYMMVLISQSIFNKSVSSTIEYRTSILAFLK